MDLDAVLPALSRGDLRAWSLHATTARRASLGIKDGQAGNPHAPFSLTESAAVHHLLVWEDGRVSRGAWERRQVTGDVARAVADARLAAYDDPDAACVLGPATLPDVQLHDARAARAAAGEVEEIAERLRAVRDLVARRSFRTWSGSFSAGLGASRVVTSAGLDARSEGTATSWHVTFNGELGDGFGARRFESDEAFRARLDRLAALVEALACDAPTGGGGDLVLFHPRVVESYVVDTLLANLDGAAVAHGQSHFDRAAFGTDTPVIREDIELRVDPLLPLRLGSYAFSGEGTPAAPTTFVERGRLVTPVLDLKYARRLGLAPTAQPSATDTISFRGGRSMPLAEALGRAAGGALILSVLGVHTQDAVSGDFSLSAPQALRIGDAGLDGRLRATISGNLFAVLRQDELAFVAFDGETTPGLLLRCRIDRT